MSGRRAATHRRLQRLAEELAEAGLELDLDSARDATVLAEVDYALRPRMHERRVPSYGAFIDATAPSGEWETTTTLRIHELPFANHDLDQSRPFADGLASWLSIAIDDEETSIVFDRPAGSERDLVVLAEASGATVVQRHPSGVVRIAGSHGVMRHDGYDWHLEPPVDGWIDELSRCEEGQNRAVLAQMLNFAVHDLGARGTGATLIFRPQTSGLAGIDRRLGTPPPLRIDDPSHLAPLSHVLTQIDGATIFDADGVLRELGVRLVPSVEAEVEVPALGGMRHTSGRRYSYDDPGATVIVVSEDGPVTVLRAGAMVGHAR